MDTTATFWMPPSASTTAGDVDSLFYFLLWVSVFFFALIVGLSILFITKWRRRKGDTGRLDTGPTKNTLLEVAWIVIPTIIVVIIFIWGFRGYMNLSVIPANAMEVKVTGQQWFWSFQYPEGASTVNELVVPVDTPVKLTLSSQDVIHAFYVPSFRIKRDVLPNRYQFAWFEATHTGEYDLFCAEYCGSKHSQMTGTVRVLSGADYKAWLEGAALAGEGMAPAEYGGRLYESKACVTCHSLDGTPGNGPSFLGVFGHEVTLEDGSTVIADENYIRESILNPKAKLVAGYQAVMPTYQGLLSDGEIDALVAFIKSVGGEGE